MNLCAVAHPIGSADCRRRTSTGSPHDYDVNCGKGGYHGRKNGYWTHACPSSATGTVSGAGTASRGACASSASVRSTRLATLTSPLTSDRGVTSQARDWSRRGRIRVQEDHVVPVDLDLGTDVLPEIGEE